MLKIFFFILFVLFTNSAISKGTNVFGLGIYDIKFDGTKTEDAIDLRYELRLDKSLLDIGPKEDNFFFLKPFFWNRDHRRICKLFFNRYLY